MDNVNSLSNSRKVPPLPRGTQGPSPVINGREHRPSIQQLNSLGIARNPSQTSLNSESGRRRHTETIPLMRQSSRQHYDSQPFAATGADYYRTGVMSLTQPGGDSDMANQLLKIAREQNQNLKDQNTFLLTKVRQMTVREKGLKDTLGQYEVIIAELTNENEYLRREVTELTEDAKHKVEEFGAKLSMLMKERTPMDREQANDDNFRSDGFEILQVQSNQPSDRPSIPSQHMFPTINSNVDGGWQGLHQYISNNELNRSKPQMTSGSGNEPKSDHQEPLMDELNNQFEALIYSCRVEKNPEKRKQIRKRLVDLTYKMRALGSK